ncbi:MULTISPECIES: hypothetical protein [unclassified Moraxella]|uniref:hypothetical protein n=1 Tax=unclassified Moraxella TaxID=2685852 RepID=UPI003AF47276
MPISQTPPTQIIVPSTQATPSVPKLQPMTDKQAIVKNEASTSSAPIAVSPNNPCPFLRGLVAQGLLPNDNATPQQISDAIHHIQNGQDLDEHGERKKLPTSAIKLIASTANGLSPSQIWHNTRQGVKLDDLRGSPFDKHGVNSRILSQTGEYDEAELARFASFGSPKHDESDNQNTEIGLNEAEIKAMLDANAERAKDQKRLFDRMIMDGEFPVLLKVLGKQGRNAKGESERYLAVSDVKNLFEHRQFPERIAKRIGLKQR